jgi:hypothetical protein
MITPEVFVLFPETRKGRFFFASGIIHPSRGIQRQRALRPHLNDNHTLDRTAMNDHITHNHTNDGIDRRGFLKCMAWAGTGVIWTLNGGILTSRALGQAAGAGTPAGAALAPAGTLNFVQISDSHIGFNETGQHGRRRDVPGDHRTDQRDAGRTGIPPAHRRPHPPRRGR